MDAQRRLIELLREKRQAVIAHVVAKGLDPAAQMKDSSIEWLGNMPAHWNVSRLSHVAEFRAGKAHEPYIDDEGEFIYVGARFVSTGGASLRFCDKNLCPTEVGDILMVMSDLPNGRALARAFLVTDNTPFAVNQRVCIVRSITMDARYLCFQLDRNQGLLRYDDGVNQTHLSNSDFTTLAVIAPPLGQQQEIAKFLLQTTGRIDALVIEGEAAVNLLAQRRAALISAAVTGRIDVRNWRAAHVRKAVSAEIIYLHARNPTFGRVKNQKLLYLAEAHAGIHEIGGRYVRDAAGPYDSDLMALIERELAADGALSVSQKGGPGSAVTYSVTRGLRPDRESLKAMLGDRLAALEHVNAKLANLDTRSAEAVATLYAVWNDALLGGEACDDARVIRGFLDEWHPEKREKFKAADLHPWLDWIRRNGLVPQGRGPKTATGRLFV